MMRRIIVDTGPLVAFLDRAQTHHAWIVAEAAEMHTPWLTCEPVLTEAWHLLRGLPAAQDAVLRLVESGAVVIALNLRDQVTAIQSLRRKYLDVPMSLADACLVRLSELHADHHVCTLDSDFAIYRRHGRQPIHRLSPA
jgi:predicted nucleic acid-binding protein